MLSKAIAMHLLAFDSDMGLNPDLIETIQQQITTSNLPDVCEEDDAVKELFFPDIRKLIKEATGKEFKE